MSGSKVRKLQAFLVYRASDQSLRINKGVSGTIRLAWDEVAFKVEVSIPDPWGRLAGSVLIDLPENGPAVIEVVRDAEVSS